MRNKKWYNSMYVYNKVSIHFKLKVDLNEKNKQKVKV